MEGIVKAFVESFLMDVFFVELTPKESWRKMKF